MEGGNLPLLWKGMIFLFFWERKIFFPRKRMIFFFFWTRGDLLLLLEKDVLLLLKEYQK